MAPLQHRVSRLVIQWHLLLKYFFCLKSCVLCVFSMLCVIVSCVILCATATILTIYFNVVKLAQHNLLHSQSGANQAHQGLWPQGCCPLCLIGNLAFGGLKSTFKEQGTNYLLCNKNSLFAHEIVKHLLSLHSLCVLS